LLSRNAIFRQLCNNVLVINKLLEEKWLSPSYVMFKIVCAKVSLDMFTCQNPSSIPEISHPVNFLFH
jgi:hypothetical protein